jgi:hypothetical protein
MDAFKTELSAMQNLLVQQRGIVKDTDLEKIASIQSSAFATRAKSLAGLKADEVGELTTLIQGGPWNQEQRAELVLALSTAMTAAECVSAGKGAKDKRPKRKCQELLHFQKYSTEADNVVYDDATAGMVARLKVALSRLGKLEAVLISVESKRHVLSVVCATMKNHSWKESDLRAWYVYLKKEYKVRFKNREANATIGHIESYPEDPKLISPAKIAIMYGDELPTPMSIGQGHLDTLHNMIWCRGNAVALRDEDVVAFAVPSVPASSSNEPQAMLQNMFSSFMNMMQHGQNNVQGNVQLLERPPVTPQRRSPLKAIASNGTGTVNDGADIVIAGHQQLALPAPLEDSPKEVQAADVLTPQDQAKKFLADLKGNADEEEEEEIGGAVASKAGGKGKGKGKKGKAAKAKAKPANAKLKATDKPTAKGKAKTACRTKVKGWPDSKRIKEYPSGCSKCAWKTPGCTPSCFKARKQV